MRAIEQQERPDNALDLREKSRYAASVRLSLAPMMEWIAGRKSCFKSVNQSFLRV